MAHLLTVDPGLHAIGLALWTAPVDGELVRAWAIRGAKAGRGPAAWAVFASGLDIGVPPGHLVVETMRVYPGSREDPDDLLELSGVAGVVTGVLASRGWTTEGVRAADWNGQVRPAVRRNRTQTWVLERGWLDRVNLRTTARVRQDVWSAVSIGRWYTSGPTGRRRR